MLRNIEYHGQVINGIGVFKMVRSSHVLKCKKNTLWVTESSQKNLSPEYEINQYIKLFQYIISCISNTISCCVIFILFEENCIQENIPRIIAESFSVACTFKDKDRPLMEIYILPIINENLFSTNKFDYNLILDILTYSLGEMPWNKFYPMNLNVTDQDLSWIIPKKNLEYDFTRFLNYELSPWFFIYRESKELLNINKIQSIILGGTFDYLHLGHIFFLYCAISSIVDDTGFIGIGLANGILLDGKTNRHLIQSFNIRQEKLISVIKLYSLAVNFKPIVIEATLLEEFVNQKDKIGHIQIDNYLTNKLGSSIDKYIKSDSFFPTQLSSLSQKSFENKLYFNIHEITDCIGISHKFDFQRLYVTTETLKGGIRVNHVRKDNNKNIVDIFVTRVVNLDRSSYIIDNKLSSSEIREKITQFSNNKEISDTKTMLEEFMKAFTDLFDSFWISITTTLLKFQHQIISISFLKYLWDFFDRKSTNIEKFWIDVDNELTGNSYINIDIRNSINILKQSSLSYSKGKTFDITILKWLSIGLSLFSLTVDYKLISLSNLKQFISQFTYKNKIHKTLKLVLEEIHDILVFFPIGIEKNHNYRLIPCNNVPFLCGILYSLLKTDFQFVYPKMIVPSETDKINYIFHFSNVIQFSLKY